MRNSCGGGASFRARAVRGPTPAKSRSDHGRAQASAPSTGAPGMGTEQEVRVLWGPDGGNPNRRDKGADGGEGKGVTREGASIGSLRWSAKPNESEAP